MAGVSCDVPAVSQFRIFMLDATRWNHIRYTIWAPIYDVIKPLFDRHRRKSIALLHIERQDRVLLIGCGTGLDLEHLPPAKEILATDLTPAMVERTAKRMKVQNIKARAAVMDAQALVLPDASYNKIIMHLILAVVPDPVRSLQEAERVLKPGGEIAVFDKFVPPGQRPHLMRRFFNLVTKPLFTSIDRRFEDILRHTSLVSAEDMTVGMGLGFRIILLRKPK